MPLGEIVGEMTGAALRLVSYLFIDLVLDVAVRGLGYAICRPFSKSIDPDGVAVLCVGVAVWMVIIWLGVTAYGFVKEFLVVDSCLDRGGRFDYESGRCAPAG